MTKPDTHGDRRKGSWFSLQRSPWTTFGPSQAPSLPLGSFRSAARVGVSPRALTSPAVKLAAPHCCSPAALGCGACGGRFKHLVRRSGQHHREISQKSEISRQWPSRLQSPAFPRKQRKGYAMPCRYLAQFSPDRTSPPTSEKSVRFSR